MNQKEKEKISKILNKDYPYAGDTQFPVIINLVLNAIELSGMGSEVLKLPHKNEKRKGERRQSEA